jgi:phosphinothricin acetyltransferase
MADVRLATGDDAAAIQAIYAPYVVSTPISFEYDVPGVGEIGERISSTMPECPWLVAEASGNIVGYAYAHGFAPRAAYRWSVETSIYLDPAGRGRGVGRALYTCLLDLITAQGYHEAFAGITLPNPASVALHEALGFTPAAMYHRVGWKMGAWQDVGWWQRALAGASPDPPAPPLPLDQLPPAVLGRVLSAPGS